MIYVVTTYLLYLAISVAITVWVARTLHKNGRLFLVDAFHGNEPLADSINHLLVVGFYLINIGYVSLALKYGDKAADVQQLIETLSTKVGAVLLILGAMHFFNLYVFSKMRKRALLHGAPPPVPPQSYTPVVP
jgi:p-aminobenzoyl-glutamate transporter AbgT